MGGGPHLSAEHGLKLSKHHISGLAQTHPPASQGPATFLVAGTRADRPLQRCSPPVKWGKGGRGEPAMNENHSRSGMGGYCSRADQPAACPAATHLPRVGCTPGQLPGEQLPKDHAAGHRQVMGRSGRISSNTSPAGPTVLSFLLTPRAPHALTQRHTRRSGSWPSFRPGFRGLASAGWWLPPKTSPHCPPSAWTG